MMSESLHVHVLNSAEHPIAEYVVSRSSDPFALQKLIKSLQADPEVHYVALSLTESGFAHYIWTR